MSKPSLTRPALALVVTAALIALTGGVAQAGQVTRESFHGPFAEAAWESTTPNSITDGFVLASTEQNGTTHVTVDEVTQTLDTNGALPGAVQLHGEATLGTSFAIDKVKLTSASASANIPMTRCTFDASGNPTGCQSAGTLNASIGWTGYGPIVNYPYTSLSMNGGVIVIEHGNGPLRQATAAINLGGTIVDPSTIQSADMGVGHNNTVTVCPTC
jgi:hypothetical protein